MTNEGIVSTVTRWNGGAQPEAGGEEEENTSGGEDEHEQ